MIPPLDVFSIKNDEPTWLWPAETIAQALEMVRKLGPGLYFVFFHETGRKTTYQVDETGTVQLMHSVSSESEYSSE